jgi:hypothetical protein
VCSQRQTIRGRKIDTFGKVELEREIINSFWTSILLRVPERCRKVLEMRIDKWEYDSTRHLEAERKQLELASYAIRRIPPPPNNNDIKQVVQEELSQAASLYGLIQDTILSQACSRFDLITKNDCDETNPIELDKFKANAFLGAAVLGGMTGTVGVTAVGTGAIGVIGGFGFLFVPVVLPGIAAAALGYLFLNKMVSQSYNQAFDSIGKYASEFRTGLGHTEQAVRSLIDSYRSSD